MFFSDLAKRPIDKDSPCGSNPNGLNDFDEIKRQINKLNTVTGYVSWKTVQSLSKQILTKQSKDFRCCSYFTVAATHNDGLKGLVEGLTSLLDLCVIYWYSAFPDYSKTNARMSAIEWMVENTERRLKHLRPQPDELPLIESAHQTCLRIEEELRLHYGLKAPSLGRIRRILSLWVDEIRERKQQKENANVKKKVTAPNELTLEISPPKQTVKVEPQYSTKTPNKLLIASVITGIIAVALFYFNQRHQQARLVEQIQQASISELVDIVNELSTEKRRDKVNNLRQPTVERLNQLMDGWTLDPVRVSNLKALENVTNQLVLLYPDSTSASQLQQDFQLKKAGFEAEFNNIYQRFTLARTAIANVTLQQTDTTSAQAYKYSNSLFPLLGRIEYSQKHQQQKDVERSLHLLNTYLYKINQLKTESNNVQ